jgi:restriction system protein
LGPTVMARQHVIFLTFAGDVPGVKQECWGLKDFFDGLRRTGYSDEVVIEERASLDRISKVFSNYPDRIAIFHVGGNSEPGRLLMESAFEAMPAFAEGLATLLGKQRDLKLVFLNGCSTQPQVQHLLDAGVPAVIATARPIVDSVARDFSLAFYRALTRGGEGIEWGGNLLAAFRAAQGFVTTSHGGEIRRLFAAPAAAEDVVGSQDFPWQLRIGAVKDHESLPTLLTQALIVPESKIAEGVLIESVSFAWRKILDLLIEDPSLMFQFDPRKWEEFIAGIYKKAGWDEVELTRRSGDFGRDVIATKRGIGSVRFIESVKRYTPNHYVKASDVRELGHVMNADRNVSKGIISTTWEFAPKIEEDPFIRPYLPHRIELINGQKMMERLAQLTKLG